MKRLKAYFVPMLLVGGLYLLFGDQEWWGKYTPRWIYNTYCGPSPFCRTAVQFIGFGVMAFMFVLMSLDAKSRLVRIVDAAVAIVLLMVAIALFIALFNS